MKTLFFFISVTLCLFTYPLRASNHELVALLRACDEDARNDPQNRSSLLSAKYNSISLPTGMQFAHPFSLNTSAYKKLSQLPPHNVESMLSYLPHSEMTGYTQSRTHLFNAIQDVARLRKDVSSSTFVFETDLYHWYQNRHSVPERFAKSNKSWLTAKDTDKGILSTSKVVFDVKKGQPETITEQTGFGKAMVELRAYGLDAVPLIVEQFEAGDYHLRWLFEELTDRTKALAKDETIEARCKAHIKWWRDPSEHAEAIKYQMPALDAGKNFKPPEAPKKK
jgi:hypothetical protein